MKCEQHLALEAILVGLRQSGVIDKRAVQTIAAVLEETAAKARQHCPDAADGLHRLAGSLKAGPGRSCTAPLATEDWSAPRLRGMAGRQPPELDRPPLA